MAGITLQDAQKVIEAAIAKCQSMGLKMAVTVVDAHAEVVAVARMDGVQGFAADVCRGKAMATALWRQPSVNLQERANSPVLQAVSQLHGGKLVYWQGAVPIMRDGELIGAVGAGGARPEQDEEVAKAGALAIAT